jgi:hypothetical protein
LFGLFNNGIITVVPVHLTCCHAFLCGLFNNVIIALVPDHLMCASIDVFLVHVRRTN